MDRKGETSAEKTLTVLLLPAVLIAVQVLTGGEARASDYDGGRSNSGVWTNLRGEIAGCYMRSVMDGNAATTVPNQYNPAGGTAGNYAVVVQIAGHSAPTGFNTK